MQAEITKQFVEAVEKYGAKTAVVDYPDGKTQRRTSFDELMKRARQVAAHIQGKGIASHSFVTIELPAGADFLAAEMGVWLACCVAVPVGPSFPDERKTYIRQHCEAVLNIDSRLLDGINDDDPQAAISLPDEQDDAILIYTSGSTGTPKGILHRHSSIANVLERIHHSYGYGPDDRYAAGTPTYFIVGIYYWKLLRGTEVHFIPPEVTIDPIRLAEYHRDNGITLTYVSAAVYPIYRCIAPTIRIVFTGGDRVICRQVPDYRLVVNYGMSETSGVVVGNTITEPTENAPIGRPLHGVEAAILDDDLNPVPQGEEGEICLKGPFCKGYFKDEERTRELYRGGWLHTKDVGRQLPDGSIQFVNRKDWMVKVNGQRVEPGEVEAAMCSIEGISRAVVKGFASENGSQYLVGYYTVKSDEVRIEDGEIREVLERKLPSYMVPSFFVAMEQFPLNANGKIDRKSLQAPERTSSQAEYVAPRNEVETAICKYMAQALGLSQVGIDDNFRSLGGDSIQMMTLQQLCADSEVDDLHNISVGIIYQGATPRKMAEMLAEAGQRTKPQMDDYPLSILQRGYFVTNMQREGQVVNDIFNMYELDESIDLGRLSEAIRTAFTLHRGLFTRFFTDANGEPRQKIVMEELDISVENMSEEEFEAEKKEIKKPFYLLKDRLFRVRLFSITPGSSMNGTAKHYLYIDLHHIVSDGVSRQILLRDIDRAYCGLPLEPEGWTAAEMAVEESGLQESPFYQEAIQWHKDTFAGAKLISTGCHSSDDQCETICRLDVSCSQVEAFCRREGVTINALSTAAYMLLMGHYGGMDDVTMASVFSGRDDQRVTNTVGLFARGYAMRGKWTKEMPCADFLHSVGKMLVDSMSYSIIGISKAIALVGGRPDHLFIFQGDLMTDARLGGQPLKEVTLPQSFAASGLVIHLCTLRDEDRMALLMVYPKQWHNEDYIRRMAQHYSSCMNGLMNVSTVGEIACAVPNEDMF